jgi:hypothetical protein
MKKTKILKIIKQINPQEYNGMIIIPLIPFTLTTRSTKLFKNVLHELLATQKKILKKKELEILEHFSLTMKDIKIKRNFNILINDELVEITQMHENLDNEEVNIENYLKDLTNQIKNFKFSTKLTYLIFEYDIKHKHI